MRFKQWFNEAVVQFNTIDDAIKKTLEFVVTNGTWSFEPKTYGLSGMKTISVAGHFHNPKGHFFVSIHADATKPIDKYDSVSGAIDQNSHVEIIASVSIIGNWNGRRLKNLGERSNTNGGRLKTPYETAQWVKAIIDEYQPDDDGGDTFTPTPTGSNLVNV